MQDFLTLAFEAIALTAILVLPLLYALEEDTVKTCPGQLEIDFNDPQVQTLTAALAAAWKPAPKVEDSIAPFTRKAPKLEGLKIRQLKAIAKQVRLPKYNYCRLDELAARLASEVPAWQLKEAIAQPISAIEAKL